MLPHVAASSLLLAAVLASAETLRGRIVFNDHLAPADLHPSTQVSLDYGAKYAYVLESGEFSFPDVSSGFHTVQVLSGTHAFPELSVLIPKPSEDATTPSPTPFVALHNPGRQTPFDPLSPPSVGSLPYDPIECIPLAALDFYTEPGSFQALAMLKNPMVMMMLVVGLLALGLPKLLSLIDEEALSEAEKIVSSSSSVGEWGQSLKAVSQGKEAMRELRENETTGAVGSQGGGTTASAGKAGGGKGGKGGKKKR